MADPKPYILVLTARASGWGNARLREAAKSRTIGIRTHDPSKALLEVGAELSIRFHSRRIPMPAVVLPRLGPGHYENGFAVLRQFEAMGVPIINNADAIQLARDKYFSLLNLQRAGLRVPITMRILSMKDLKAARKEIKGPPWILKTFTGSMGIGTMLVEKSDQLEAVAATLWALHQPMLLQEYIRPGDATISDIRTLIIGNRILSAIRRSATRGEFRANVHRGGTPTVASLTKRERDLALKAAKVSGLEIVGVDWIESADGPVILEVNATPGFQGFEAATGIDVAGEIIDFAVKKAEIK
jgi:ribosomal protein S6--L-glutamate ligase